MKMGQKVFVPSKNAAKYPGTLMIYSALVPNIKNERSFIGPGQLKAGSM